MHILGSYKLPNIIDKYQLLFQLNQSTVKLQKIWTSLPNISYYLEDTKILHLTTIKRIYVKAHLYLNIVLVKYMDIIMLVMVDPQRADYFHLPDHSNQKPKYLAVNGIMMFIIEIIAVVK